MLVLGAGCVWYVWVAGDDVAAAASAEDVV